MTAKNLQNFLQSLSETAFVRIDGDRYRWDPLKGKGALRQELPWQIQNWEIDAKNGDVLETAFAIRLNAEAFLQNLEDGLKSRFPSFRKANLEPDRKGGYWLLVEFLDQALDADQSNLIENDEVAALELPHGLSAVHLSVIQAVGQISIFMTKHCLIGNTPGPFFIELPKILNASLFGIALSERTHFNSYLITLKSEELRSALIDYCRFSEATQQLVTASESRAFGQIKLGFEGRTWKLSWVSGEETPELLVPPMEVLEQKEVARRFQRLDELILLEDYQGALNQCREYLEKNPQSLYLVRRWAFLTLWADQPFERKYLDLMIKYDPQNLMTLSLTVREAHLNGQLDLLLESLSKLGANLGQSVADFEALDITSLTLPEMLGDAWNRKDPQRAVSCYERVLHARGEIPRILVKLIRLMRETNDFASEETYMDRLLACEVPTRTRAAIYYRLAEIKQGSEVEDACQWALRSWHTHKIQVRYATLAADLLIRLERPHDAVHVLVETSEILESDRSASRIALELKIASIWLELMQRLDLASERVNRALDLVEGDTQAYDEIIRLVKKFDDADLLIDVTVKALKLSDAKGDKPRVDRFAEVLLELVDATTDGDRARLIYETVLPFVLLEVEDFQAIFQRSDWNLPFQEIVQLAERHLKALSPEESAPFYLAFGDIAQDRLEEADVIHGYYEKALQMGKMNTRSFDFLDAFYSRAGLTSERFNLLEKKLANAQGGERAVLLRELYYFDEGVADPDKDKYALEILSEDTDDVGPVEERLQHYEALHDGASILAMMDQVEALDLDPGVQKSLFHAGFEAVLAARSPSRDEQAKAVLNKLRRLGEDEDELARLTLNHLWNSGDAAAAEEALSQLLRKGEIPDLPLGEMLERMSDSRLKVELLLQMADRANDFQEALAHERTALRLAREDSMLLGMKLDIQRRLSTKVEFTVAELEGFIGESREFGRDQDLFVHLLAQWKLGQHQDHMDFLCKVFEDELEGMESPASVEGLGLLSLIMEMDLEASSRLRFLWLEKFGGQAEIHTRGFLRHVLDDSLHWGNRGLMLTLMEFRLVQDGELDVTKVMINDFICRLMTEHHDETLRYFIDEPSVANVLSPSSLRMAMDYSIIMKDEVSFETFWGLTLKTLSGSQEAIEFFRESRRQFADLDAGRRFVEKLEAIGDTDDLDLPEDVAFELRLYLADYLAENGGAFKKIRGILEGLHALRPEEGRVAAALIACYRELKAEGELFELLEKMLPALKADPRPLKEYQISITGLEIEFGELKAKVEKIRGNDFPRSEVWKQGFTVPSSRVEHETLFSRPRDDDRATEISEEFRLEGVAVPPPVSFGMDEQTEISRVGSHPELLEEDKVPAIPHAQEFGSHASEPMSSPMHTAIAAAPKFGSMNFHLESTETQAKIPDPSSEAVSLYENTNVYTPVPEASPPPLPSKAGVAELSLATVPPHDMEMVRNETPEEERGDLSWAWKQVAKSAKPDSGLLKELLSKPLPEMTEQLIAIQVAALVEDKIADLDDFPQRIWRDPNAIQFELKWTGRMTRDQFHPGIKAPLARLLKALYPVFIQAFAREMGLSGVADRLKMRSDEILKIRRPIDFQDEVVQRSNLRFYVNAFQDSGYSLFHLPSIGDRFQFDFEKRDVYIDRNHYMATPPSHIFHRLAFLLRAVSLDYIPFLHLSASGEIYPFLMKCKRSLDQNEGMKRVLGLEKDPVRHLLSQARDRDHLLTLFGEVGTLSVDRISHSVSHFIEQIYRLNLAETLDLIGLIETISGVDLSNPRASSYQRINQSNAAKSLLAFAAELKFVKD